MQIQLGRHSRSSGSYEEIGVDSIITHSGYDSYVRNGVGGGPGLGVLPQGTAYLNVAWA